MSDCRRVVLTGLGVTAPIGNTVDETVRSLREGRHGIRPMPEWSHIPDLQCRLGATVDGLDLTKRYPRKMRRTMGRVALMAPSVGRAGRRAGRARAELLAWGRSGLAYGSTSGSNRARGLLRPALHRPHHARARLDAYLIMTHTCAANLAQYFHVRGRRAGQQRLHQRVAVDRLRLRVHPEGHADMMICGGAEEMHYATAVTFDLLMATSVRYNAEPEQSPRPFDAARDGLVVGEGAATLVLED